MLEGSSEEAPTRDGSGKSVGNSGKDNTTLLSLSYQAYLCDDLRVPVAVWVWVSMFAFFPPFFALDNNYNKGCVYRSHVCP